MKYTIVYYESESIKEPLKFDYEFENDEQAKAKLIEWVESGFRDSAHGTVLLSDGESYCDAYNKHGRAICNTSR